MNRQRVKEIIDAHTGDASVIELIWEDYTPQDENVVMLPDYYLGEEDGSTFTYVMFKIIDREDISYIKFTGRYSSWDGTEWNEKFDFIEPYEVTVTKYKKIEEPE